MMLLTKTCTGRTAFHLAAETNSVQALNKIWAWIEAVTHGLLLPQNKDRKTAWQQWDGT
jgi:hypothetical protein